MLSFVLDILAVGLSHTLTAVVLLKQLIVQVGKRSCKLSQTEHGLPYAATSASMANNMFAQMTGKSSCYFIHRSFRRVILF